MKQVETYIPPDNSPTEDEFRAWLTTIEVFLLPRDYREDTMKYLNVNNNYERGFHETDK